MSWWRARGAGGAGAADDAPAVTLPRRHTRLSAKELAQLFREIDLDENGTLSREEVAGNLNKLRIPCTPQILDEIFARADRNDDERLDFEEFARYVCNREDELATAFDEIDLNHDGALMASELAHALEMLHLHATDEQISKLVRRFSRHSGDQNVAFRDFRDFLLMLPINSLRGIFDHWARSASLDLGDNPTIPDDLEGGKSAYLVNFIAGGVAGAVSRTVTAPMDRLKVMMQASPTDISIRQGVRKITAEGLFSFWKGNGTNVVKIIPESATKFVAYEFIKNNTAKDVHDVTVWERFVAGAGAGVVAQTLIYPLEIAKTRLALSHKDEYSGISHCLNRTMLKEGPLALYRGLMPSVVGIAPYAGIDLALFMTFKERWIECHPHAVEGPGSVTLLAMGAVSSTCGAITAYPLQLIRTRLQVQGMNPDRPVAYSGAVDCLVKTLREDGVFGLYRGIGPSLLKTLPAISISYLVYEKTRLMLT